MSSSDETSSLVQALLKQTRALDRSVKAMDRQTRAINALAASNEAIVNAMLEQPGGDEPDPDAAPTHYLDGRPIRRDS